MFSFLSFSLHVNRFISVWQKRRVVITKEQIIFAYVGQDKQIDHIPLAEVLFVKEMDSNELDQNEKHHHVIQIATKEDGHNSGRIYYLSCGSKELSTKLISSLNAMAETARIQVEARTIFKKLQLRVKRMYRSSQFQGLMSLLICAVRCCLLPP